MQNIFLSIENGKLLLKDDCHKILMNLC